MGKNSKKFENIDDPCVKYISKCRENFLEFFIFDFCEKF